MHKVLGSLPCTTKEEKSKTNKQLSLRVTAIGMIRVRRLQLVWSFMFLPSPWDHSRWFLHPQEWSYNAPMTSYNILYTVNCYVPLVLTEKLVLESGFPCCFRPKDVHIKESSTAPFLEISWSSYLCCNKEKEYNETTLKQSYFTLRTARR